MAKVVIIRRHSNGTSESIPLKLQKILQGTAPDLALEGGDVLLVPEGHPTPFPQPELMDTPPVPSRPFRIPS
jgi:hypothetical protein